MRMRLPTMIMAFVLLMPALAAAGNGEYGACLLQAPDTATLFPDGKGNLGAVCIDGVPELDCLKIATGIEWFEGQTCAELEVPWEWEGSCQADVPPLGDQCYILWFDGQGDVACLKEGGEWYPDDLTCGLGVPTVPSAGLAVMGLLLLAGALVLLTFRGSVTTA